MSNLLPPPIWVAQPEALEQMAGNLANQPRLAVDTESNSLHAFREQVCLIQFSTPTTDYLIDPLALQDISPIASLFSDLGIEKVFHAVEYDQICLKRDFGITLVNIFDTMQAARILGYKQVGLDAMLAVKLDITLNKHYQKADWGERPLSPEMLNYARLDTHHLFALRDSLWIELQERGLWELACEDFARLALGNGGTRADLPAWLRVRGTKDLSKRQLAILRELCIWREAQAERMHRPVFKVMDDSHLVAIAQAAPRTIHELEDLLLTSRQIGLFGNEILRSVERGRKAPPLPRPPSQRPEKSSLIRLNAISDWRKAAARKMDVESDIVLPKAWMQAIAEKNPRNLEELSALMPHSPWRLATFATEILDALHGKKKT